MCWGTESEETNVNYSARQLRVGVGTTLSSLGLEFKAVLLLWIEQFEDCFTEDMDTRSLARRQLYAAVTRAQDELHSVAGGGTGIVSQALEKADAIETVKSGSYSLIFKGLK